MSIIITRKNDTLLRNGNIKPSGYIQINMHKNITKLRIKNYTHFVMEDGGTANVFIMNDLNIMN